MRSLALLTLVLAAACASNRDDTGTDDAGTTTTPDAGSPDAGGQLTLPANGEAAIRFGGCGTLAPCGGDPTGVWKYTDYCVDDPFATAKQACPLLNITKEEGTIKGAAAFGGGKVLRHIEVNAALAATVPSTCAAIVGGCPGIEGLLRNKIQDIACPADGSGNCQCTGSIVLSDDQSGDFTTSGNTLTTDEQGTKRTFSYCISGNDLKYAETTQGALEFGIGTLSKP